MPEILPEFNRRNPFIKVIINENTSQVLEEYLLRGHIDLYIGFNLRKNPDIEIIDMSNERLFLVVPKKIAKEVYKKEDNIFYEKTDIERFLKYDFLMLSKANRIRRMVDEYLAKKELEIKILIETENIETLFELACKGMGVTVYPEMFMKRHKALINSVDCPVSFIPLEDSIFENTFSIGYNKKRYLSYAVKEFIKLSKEIY